MTLPRWLAFLVLGVIVGMGWRLVALHQDLDAKETLLVQASEVMDRQGKSVTKARLLIEMQSALIEKMQVRCDKPSMPTKKDIPL